MTKDFFVKQTADNQKKYLTLLGIMGELSNLFSDNTIPYLYYRSMENIFCMCFDADNLSRGDVSADAAKDSVGIGLKTFLHGNGTSYQKVAEFNKASNIIRSLKGIALVRKVSEMRNERISLTMRICNLNDMMYHVVTRTQGKMLLYEEHMDLIDINNLKINSETSSIIDFTDGIHDYKFYLSKSTLFKRFNTDISKPIDTIDIEILDDPFSFLLNCHDKSIKKVVTKHESVFESDYIVLPLYSPRSKQVETKSGLNQWNANGRQRNINEVYISIPSWIHKSKPNFFKYCTSDYKTDHFNVILPNRKIIEMKVAQAGGKALMSNPNKALGEWILREILQLPQNKLVTKEQLDIIGIDSVKLTRINEDTYYLDFMRSGSFEEFEENYRKK